MTYSQHCKQARACVGFLPTPATRLHHFAFNANSKEEVNNFYKLLIEIGATILDPPAEYNYSPGYYAVFFADPDGIKLELVHMPALQT